MTTSLHSMNVEGDDSIIDVVQRITLYIDEIIDDKQTFSFDSAYRDIYHLSLHHKSIAIKTYYSSLNKLCIRDLSPFLFESRKLMLFDIFCYPKRVFNL